MTIGSNLLSMATIAPRRPAWRLPGTVAGSARLRAPLAVGVLVLLSVLLRTRNFGVGFWIDEGLSVGIADRPLSDIPAALRLDGSPPLYYALLHAWISVFGDSETATHALSLLFTVLAVPAAWWAARGLFGETAGLAAALLAATNPFLTHYAQETRMYALVALLGVLACGAFGRAYVLTGTDAAPSRAAASSTSHVSPQPPAKKSAQLCVYISAASATANAAAQRRRTEAEGAAAVPVST